MGMAEELARLAKGNREEFTEFRKEIKGAFQHIRNEHQKAAKTNKELVEEQEREIYEKSEQAKHDQYEAASARKIGVVAEEPASDKPHTRAARHNDATTRSITTNHPDEEESEPYRRPERWHDQDDEEEEPPAASPHRDWGGSIRRIGGHTDEDE
jgi:hypothetical protein